MRMSELLSVAAAAVLVMGMATNAVLAQSSKAGARLAKTQFTLAEAVEKAKAQAPGKAIDVELKDRGGVIFYEVEIITDDAQKEIQLDAASGEVVGLKTKTLTPTTMSKDDTRMMEAVKTAKLTLPQAVETAKKKFGGRAVEAELETSRRGNYYEIELVDGDRVREVKVAADSGEILSMDLKR